MIELTYSGGSILIRGYEGELPPDIAIFDNRIMCYRALGMNYEKVAEYLKSKGKEFTDNVCNCPDIEVKANIKLRPYQSDALDKWASSNMRGTIVLPTAAGKTHIGIEAINRTKKKTIILVPTIDLLTQWKQKIKELLNLDAGQIGGGEKEEREITVSTYDSAYLMAEKYGNHFDLIIADEVHHLASEKLRMIAMMYTARYRLGLTATYERTDGLEKDLEYLMGGKIFELGYEEIDEYLADYKIVRIPVELDDDEQTQYEKYHSIFVNYLRKHRMAIGGSWDFNKFIRSSWTPEGREALTAWRKSREIAMNPAGKIEMARTLVAQHKNERIIIFSEDTETTYRISKEFLIPAITYMTSKDERSEIPELFKTGKYNVIATSRVLDEGVDFPDASVAIVMSGSGSTRQFRQRLGRILRPSYGKKAVMYELVTSQTAEFGASRRRRKGVPSRTTSSEKD